MSSLLRNEDNSKSSIQNSTLLLAYFQIGKLAHLKTFFLQNLPHAPVVVPVREIETYTDKAKDLLFNYGPRFLTAILVLVIGIWLINLFIRGLNKIMMVRDVDPTLRPFLKTIISIALKIMLILSVAGMIGIQTTSFLAALGAAGLAIGLALQGSLSNFAGGMLILLFKPFRVGDFIEAQGHKGIVNEIQILYTILTTTDNKKVIIPNGNLSNNDVVNFTANDLRRLDININVAYHSDIRQAMQILHEIVAAEEMILKEPEPGIGVDHLTDTGIKVSLMLWIRRENYWPARYAINQKAVEEFGKAGIDMPAVLVETERTVVIKR